MAPLAATIAKTHGYPPVTAVIRELKKNQITGEERSCPFFEQRLHQIEQIIVAQNLVTLPARPAIIRLASAAETAQQPRPAWRHRLGRSCTTPGSAGEFVLPLNIPSATQAV